jgi:SLA1 Homology Domain 1 (SHD1) protein
MERLNTDRSIAPLVAQFVPLKIETDGDQWGPFSRKYSHEGNGIPIIFVVRADGEKMYGKSGSLGDELPRFLSSQLASAGRILTPAQLSQIQTAVSDAQQALQSQDPLSAVKRLDTLKKIAPAGKLGSYAAAAIAADQLAAQLVEDGKAALASAQEKLSSGDKFAGALGILSANRIYGALPELKKDLGAAERELRKDGSLKEIVAQAEAVDKALALVSTKNGKKTAAEALAKVAARFPDSDAAKVAQEKIAELESTAADGQTGAFAPPVGSDKYRTWTDVTGSYKIEAELVEATDAAVTLKRKEDGRIVKVPIEKLSPEDQEFLKSQ